MINIEDIKIQGKIRPELVKSTGIGIREEGINLGGLKFVM